MQRTYYLDDSNSARLNSLNSRLDMVNNKIEQEKELKRRFIHSKINDIEQRLDYNIINSRNKFAEIKESLNYLNALFYQMKTKDEIYLDKKTEILAKFEQKINIKFDEQKIQRIDLEQDLSKKIDDKYNEFKILIANEVQERENKLQRLQSLKERDFPKFQMLPKTESKIRTDNDEQNKNEIKKTIEDFKVKIIKEKQIRESNEQAFIDTLKISLNKYQNDIQNERKTRNDNLTKLVNLAEMACEHIINKNKNQG